MVHHNDAKDRMLTHRLWAPEEEEAPRPVKEWGADVCRLCGAAESELYEAPCEAAQPLRSELSGMKGFHRREAAHSWADAYRRDFWAYSGSAIVAEVARLRPEEARWAVYFSRSHTCD